MCIVCIVSKFTTRLFLGNCNQGFVTFNNDESVTSRLLYKKLNLINLFVTGLNRYYVEYKSSNIKVKKKI